MELNKNSTPLSAKADGMMVLEIPWASAPFKELVRMDAGDLEDQLVGTLRGISLLGNALKRPAVIGRQVTELSDWVKRM